MATVGSDWFLLRPSMHPDHCPARICCCCRLERSWSASRLPRLADRSIPSANQGSPSGSGEASSRFERRRRKWMTENTGDARSEQNPLLDSLQSARKWVFRWRNSTDLGRPDQAERHRSVRRCLARGYTRNQTSAPCFRTPWKAHRERRMCFLLRFPEYCHPAVLHTECDRHSENLEFQR